MAASNKTNIEQMSPHLFAKELWGDVQALLNRLDESQSLWLSGFLAARHPIALEQAISPVADSRIWIAFGSETGNCELLASRLAQQLDRMTIPYQVVSLAEIKPRALQKVHYLFVICSTHGDGDPPEPCIGFFDGLMAEHAPKLNNTKFAVLALGDSSYDHFCTAGKKMDDRLALLGAERLMERMDCDVDFETPATGWIESAAKCLPKQQLPIFTSTTSKEKVSTSKSTSSRQNIILAEVLENICLSNRQRNQPVHHIELLVEQGTLQLEPGDAVGVLPQNPPDLVAGVLDAAGFSGDEAIKINKRAVPLVEGLREFVDLTIPGALFLHCWAQASNSSVLQQLCQVDRKQQRQFLRTVQVIDVLRAYPGATDAQTFVDALRPLQPRLYDVANVVTADTDEIHLTVKDFKYQMRDRRHSGIASQYLLQLQPGEEVRIYSHINKRFHLPEDESPLIFIANGTGIAPCRAFLQQLNNTEKNVTWLIFQEYCAEEDFLYQLDMQYAAEKNVLRHVDTLFTTDQPEIQLIDIIQQQRDRLQEWLSRGAHVYICGEKAVLGNCEEAMKTLSEHCGYNDVWSQVISEKRIHRNLY